MTPFQIKIARWTLACLGTAYLTYSGYYLSGSTQPMLSSFTKLQEGQKVLVTDPDKAAVLFDEAGKELASTADSLRSSPELIRIATVLPPFRWQVRLIKAGYALSQTGKITADLARTAPRINKTETDVSVILSSTNESYSTWYHQNTSAINSLEQQLFIASQELHAVPPWITFQHRHDFQLAEETTRKASGALSAARRTIASTEAVLGAHDERTRTFLVLFQNNSELRTTGGFIGSYALLTAHKGKLTGFRFGANIYKIDKTFSSAHPLTPPRPLQFLTPTYAFRDSNTENGFLNTAVPQVVDLFSQETGTKVDGVLLLDTTILEDIVNITGPIDLPTTKGMVSADAATIRTALTTEIEKNYFTTKENKKENEPKQIIADLIPILLSKIQSMPNGFTKLTPILKRSVERKGIQIWMADKKTSATLTGYFPLDSPQESGHWLKIVNNNLGANKSSTSVHQKVEMDQKSDEKHKRLSVTLKIIQKHRGTGVWPDGNNLNYLEVYLPKEASIISAPLALGDVSGLDTNQRNNITNMYSQPDPLIDTSPSWKRVSFWLSNVPGKSSQRTLTYTLPLTPAFENHFTYIKQAGALNETFVSPSYRFADEVASNLFLTR